MTDWLRVFLVFSSIIFVPLIWLKLRGKKAGDQEGSYPEPQRSHPDWRSDDHLKAGMPGAEAPVYGPTRSTPDAYMDFQTLKHGWTHRDITYYMNRFLKGKRKASARIGQETDEEAKA